MNQSTASSTILAIDLGKFRSVACLLEPQSGQHRYLKLDTTPAAVHDLLVEHEPARVVIEIGSQAGWVCDVCRALGIEVQVANTAHDAWKWKNTRRKTDKDDALKLAQLSSMGQLPTVVVPVKKVRQWRALIAYRTSLVRRRTMVKNHVRSILDREGLRHPAGAAGWNEQGLKALLRLAMPLEACDPEELWRGRRRKGTVTFSRPPNRYPIPSCPAPPGSRPGTCSTTSSIAGTNAARPAPPMRGGA